MYYQGLGQGLDDSDDGVFWCQATQESFGPDGKPADKCDCVPGRSCYTE